MKSKFQIRSNTVQNSEVGVNYQQGQFSTCRYHKRFEKYFSNCWKMTQGINFTTFGLNFKRWKLTPGSIVNVEKRPTGQFSTRVNILRYIGSLLKVIHNFAQSYKMNNSNFKVNVRIHRKKNRTSFMGICS